MFTYYIKLRRVWVTLTETYIFITTKPMDKINWNKDSDINKYVTGFDRCDGINYYKLYEHADVVDSITKMLDTLHIQCRNSTGKIIIPVDPD